MLKWQEADKKIERVLAILGGHYGIVNDNEYIITLFFLLIRKDELDNAAEYMDHNDFKVFMSDMIEAEMDKREISGTRRQYWEEIMTNAMPIVEKVFNDKIPQIFQTIREIDQKIIDEDFTSFFDHVLFFIGEKFDKSGKIHQLPKEVVELVERVAFAEFDENDIPLVYNPYSRCADFGVFSRSYMFNGQESEKMSYFIGIMRILAHDAEETTALHNTNPKVNWDEQEYDLILSYPPIVKFNNSSFGLTNTVNSPDHFLLENGMKSLNVKGKMILLLPNSFLYALGYEAKLKKSLLESDFIDTVVKLPENLLSSTALSLSLVVFSNYKDEFNKGKVRFIDASNCKKRDERRHRNTLTKEIYELIEQENDTDLVRKVQNTVIIENDCILLPNRYFVNQYDGVALKEFTQQIRTVNQADTQGKYIRVRNLSDNFSDARLDLSSVNEEEIPSRSIEVRESVLLLSTRWKNFKATYFEYSGEPIFVMPDIAVLKVDESIMNIDYLLHELFSNYVQEQYEAFLTGVTIPYIRKNDLMSIKVKALPLAEQELIVDYISGALEPLELKLDEKNSSELIKEKELFQEMASLKHTLGSPRQNILSGATLLLKFMEGNHKSIDALKDHFNEIYGKKITDILESIKKDVNFISQVLERGENGLILEEFPLEFISLQDLYHYLDEIDDTRYKFKISVIFAIIPNLKDFVTDTHPIEGDAGRIIEETGINGNRVLLRTLFDNILENANKHGFDEKVDSNEVKILIIPMPTIGACNIKVWNNGKPFPKGYSKEKFITKYSTKDIGTGTGLGGYDINRIVQYFGGSWVFSHEMEGEDQSNNLDDFPVQYDISFPIEL